MIEWFDHEGCVNDLSLSFDLYSFELATLSCVNHNNVCVCVYMYVYVHVVVGFSFFTEFAIITKLTTRDRFIAYIQVASGCNCTYK